MKKNNKGFTLAELLIVVAIIAVLTVVAVPIFTTQLEKSREETDIANMREAKAAAGAAYLADEKIDSDKPESLVGPSIAEGTSSAIYWDVEAGKLVAEKPTNGYGKGTATDGKCEPMFGYEGTTVAKDKVILVNVDRDGNIGMSWVD